MAIYGKNRILGEKNSQNMHTNKLQYIIAISYNEFKYECEKMSVCVYLSEWIDFDRVS